MSEYASILERLTEGRALPEGCDSWALKATDFAGRTRGGFEWPDKGWVEASGPFDEASTDPCPSWEGDGVCVALTYRGMASGGHRALAMMLVAFAESDVLGRSADKLRLRKALVVERLDGERAVRDYGRGADLTGASLARANLTRADLTCANLTCADLTYADLTYADLTGASLAYANLTGASLAYAEGSARTRWPDGFDYAKAGVTIV